MVIGKVAEETALMIGSSQAPMVDVGSTGRILAWDASPWKMVWGPGTGDKGVIAGYQGQNRKCDVDEAWQPMEGREAWEGWAFPLLSPEKMVVWPRQPRLQNAARCIRLARERTTRIDEQQ